MTNNKQQTEHRFCLTPELKCTMSYCDENGCINRQRHLVGDPIEMTNNKQQTAVEQIKQFLYSEICERRDYSASRMCEEVLKFIEQIENGGNNE
jgi:leucyl-tRNA synthetase